MCVIMTTTMTEKQCSCPSTGRSRALWGWDGQFHPAMCAPPLLMATVPDNQLPAAGLQRANGLLETDDKADQLSANFTELCLMGNRYTKTTVLTENFLEGDYGHRKLFIFPCLGEGRWPSVLSSAFLSLLSLGYGLRKG